MNFPDPPLAPLGFRCLPDSGGSTGTGTTVSVQTYRGTLPQDAPLKLPTPQAGALVGSAEYVANGQMALIDVEIVAPQTPVGVVRFYRQALADLNWSPAPAQGLAQAIQAGESKTDAGPPIDRSALHQGAFRGAVYCSGAGPWLIVWAGPAPAAGGLTGSAVWVEIQAGGGAIDPCTTS